ncbi:MAG: hypothetical protein MAG451_01290 [Anaerolineales bacterium]|nr:hypothetical protein [Anaerolineales bacterium]
MSQSKLQAVIGAAIVDPTFRDALLESPRDVLDDFALTSVEREAILNIRADSLSEFATKLQAWIVQQRNKNMPHMMA